MKEWKRKGPIRIEEYFLVLASTVNLVPLHPF